MIRLGGHGLTVSSDDPVAFARAHRDFGYAAAYCPPVQSLDSARLVEIEKAFSNADVMIAEIGIWRNLLAIEPEARSENLDHAYECLAVADAVGAKCAVSYIGSFAPHTDYAPHEDNLGPRAFDATVETVRNVIDTVKPKRAKFALEMMQYSLPDSVDSYLDLIAAVDRPAFAAHIDPVNLIMTPRRYYYNAEFLTDCFTRLAPHIVSCHAKDILLRHQAALHFDEVLIGEGVLDYSVFLKLVDGLPRDVPLMLEHLESSEYAVAKDRVVAIGELTGVAFR